MDRSDIVDLDGDEPIKILNEKIGAEVYRDAWEEFYRWEHDECQRTLDPLASSQDPSLQIPMQLDLNEQEFHPDAPADDGPESFTAEEFDEDENCVRYYTLMCFELAADRILGHPRYEICTPASYNYDKDPSIGNGLAFIPYADDDAFPVDEYLGYFSSLSWQTDFRDPDLELIQVETATRLYFDHDFSLEEIDRLGFLKETRISRSSGLLWDTAQRDLLWWTGIFEKPTIPTAYVSTSSDIFSHINQDIQIFCPSLNCLRSFCATHPTPYHELDTTVAKVTSVEMLTATDNACGDGCFRHVYQEDFPLEGVDWDENEMEMVRGIFKLIPDQSPCDLAVICRKKCFEIFAFRCTELNDSDIENSGYVNQPVVRKPIFVDDYLALGASPKFSTVRPCHHRGPCDQFSCACYQNNQHCQRTCRCEIDCSIRWKGCDCRPRKKKGKIRACESYEHCKCRKAGRECDPDLCTRCDARGKKGRYCRNAELQRSKFPLIIIQPGTYGLGAFAGSPIPEGTIIGEYVGEILHGDAIEHDSIPMIHTYTGLNYIFDLDSTVNLDAVKIGNETRYLNDAKDEPEKYNCEARVYLVNGDHRIVLAASKKVNKGSELFLDYGAGYWDPPGKRKEVDE